MRVAVGLLERADVRREVLGAAGVDGADAPARTRWRLEVAVEVVEGEELHLDLVSVLDDRWLIDARRARGQDECHGTDDEANESQPKLAAHSLSPLTSIARTRETLTPRAKQVCFPVPAFTKPASTVRSEALPPAP